MDEDPARFELRDAEVDIDTLVVGYTEYGLAGFTAVDYPSDQFEMSEH